MLNGMHVARPPKQIPNSSVHRSCKPTVLVIKFSSPTRGANETHPRDKGRGLPRLQPDARSKPITDPREPICHFRCDICFLSIIFIQIQRVGTKIRAEVNSISYSGVHICECDMAYYYSGSQTVSQ
jgi:hypothetical protein